MCSMNLYWDKVRWSSAKRIYFHLVNMYVNLTLMLTNNQFDYIDTRMLGRI